MAKCTKHAFWSETKAKKALHLALRSRSGRRREIRHYRCPICRAWHLTSKHE